MSVDLIKKREEIVSKICLEKNIDTKSKVIVNFIIDGSSSMNEKSRGSKIRKIDGVQNTVERIYPIASTLSGEDKAKSKLDSYIFSNNFEVLKPVTLSNYMGYVKVEIIDKNRVGGGTYCAPVIKHIVKRYKGTKIPVFNIYMTDGENFDPTETADIISKSSGEKIFWQFIGIGDSTFNFLEKLQQITGRVNRNTSFFSVNDLADMSDEVLYDKLFDVFSKFLKDFKQGDGTVSSTCVTAPFTPVSPFPTSALNTRSSKKKGWFAKVVDGISDFFG